MKLRYKNEKFVSSLFKALLFIAAVINLGSTSYAATKTWDGTTSSMNDPSNWDPVGVPITDDDLVFPNGASVTNLNNDIPGSLVVGDITFSNPYTITGHSFSILQGTGKLLNFNTTGTNLSLQASSPGVVLSGTWTVTSAPSPGNTINSVIQGGMDGPNLSLNEGFLVLGLQNQFNGLVSIGTLSKTGTLQSGAGGAFGSIGFTPTITLLGNSTLDLNNHENMLRKLRGDGGTLVTLGSASLTLTEPDTDSPFYGVISGSGTLAINGGSFALMEASTYTGETNISGGGALNVRKGVGASSQIAFSSGSGSLIFGSDQTSSTDILVGAPAFIGVGEYDVTLSGEISGNSTLQKFGRGTLTLTHDNSNLTGPLVLSGGNLNVTTASLGNISSIVFDVFGGTLQLGENMTIDKPITLSNRGGVDTNGHDVIISTPITGPQMASASYPFIKMGQGTLTLTSIGNNYAGKTQINEGILSVSSTTYSSNSPQLVFNQPGNGVLQITEDFLNFPSSIVLMGDGIIDTNGHDMAIPDIVAGLSAHTFTKEGLGTLTFSGANIYRGPTQVNAGTLKAGASSTPSSGAFGISSAITVANNASLDFQTFANTVGDLANSGSILSSATITATSYAQNSNGALELNFPTNQASPVGNIAAMSTIDLDGALNVTSTGGFSLTPGAEVILLQSSGSGKQLSGTFSSTTLPFGTLKYDYGDNQVILKLGGCDGIWTSPTDGNWASTGNWSSGCAPGINNIPSDQDTATFEDVGAAAITVTLANAAGTSSQPVTLHDINFNAPNTAFTIDPFNTSSTITLDSVESNSKPLIHLTAGNVVINAPIILAKDSRIALSSGTLTLGASSSITSNDHSLDISTGNTTGTLTNNGSITPTQVIIEGNTINNHGTIHPSGVLFINDLSPTHPTIVTNYSSIIAGSNFAITITGNASSVDNQGIMSATEDFLISSGSITNRSGAQFNAGSGHMILMSGGSLKNEQGGLLGTANSDIAFTSGTITTADQINVNTYTQGSSAHLELEFPTNQPSPVGKVLAGAQIVLDGLLQVNNTGGFVPTPGDEVTLLESSGSGKQLSGAFSSVTLPFGTLKYDYSDNKVYIKVGSCDGIWTSPTDGNWASAGNWSSGCAPGINNIPSDQDTATFEDVAAAAVTVTLADAAGTSPQSVTLHDINFNAPNTIFTIEPFDSSSTITLDSLPSSSKPLIHLIGGDVVINAPIILAKDSRLALSSGTLTLEQGGSISSNTNTLEISEGNTTGTLTNNGTITPVDLLIEGNIVNNNGTIQTSGMIVINDLPGIDNPIVVNNFSTIAAGSSLTIGGNASVTNQGGITSIGDLVISGGTVINQLGGVLNAGSGAKLTVSGGSLTNAQGAVLGSQTSDLVLSGGSVTTSGQIFANNYTQTPPAILQLNFSSPSSFGSIAASGRGDLGGTMIVNACPNCFSSSTQTFELITAEGGISERFSSVFFQNFPSSVIPNLRYLSNAVELDIKPVIPNHFSGHSHIIFSSVKQHNSFIRRKCFQLRNRALVTQKERNIAEVSKGEISLKNPLSKDFHIFTMEQQENGNAIAQLASHKQKEKETTKEEPVHQKPWKLFAGPITTFGQVKAQKDQVGLHYASAGGLLGCDYLLTEVEKSLFDIGIGGIIQYRKQWGHAENHSGDFNSHLLHGSLFSTLIPRKIPEISLEAILGFAYLWDHLDRKTGIDNQDIASSNTHEKMIDALLGMEYNFSFLQNFSFTPFLYLQYMHNQIDGFKERGAGIYNLSVPSQTIHSFSTLLGARTCYTYIASTFSLTFEFDAEWIREYAHKDRAVSFTPFVITTTPTTVTAAGASRNSVLLALNTLADFNNDWEIEANATFQLNSSFYDCFFYLGVGRRF